MKNKITAFFDQHKDQIRAKLVTITTDLVKAPTVNAGKGRMSEFPYLEVPGQERLAADVVAKVLDEWDIPYEIHEGGPQRANIIATLPGNKPTLMMGLHLDVVPPGKGWDTDDPFEVVLKDGKLIGRGVLDNKGPLASSLMAMWIIKESGVQLNGTFQVAGLASEEFREPGEMDPGIEFLLTNKLIAPDMAVIPDIGEEMKRIDIAEKGRVVYRIVTRGLAAHGSTPELGVNAANMMAHVVVALEGLEMPHEVHPVLGSPSANLGILRGGEAANIVPDECEIELDVRVVPGQSAESVRLLLLETAQKALEGRYDPKHAHVEVHTNDATSPHGLDAGHPLVVAVQDSAEAVLGFRPEPFGIGGGTFAKAFNLGGIPAVGFGPGLEDQFHVVNEAIELEELVQFSLVAALIACDLLGE